ncbi:hypothetical protein HDG35_006656 [Paraburkholderia sp. JPY681]|nr:hypothetical protein [Paraburkholderia atlantica]
MRVAVARKRVARYDGTRVRARPAIPNLQRRGFEPFQLDLRANSTNEPR